MIRYHIYTGDNNGGPVDLTRPVGDADLPAFTITLPFSSVTRVIVRAYDTDNGYEESNTDEIVVKIDAEGRDVSQEPAAPLALTAVPAGVDGVTVTWSYLGQPGKPDPDSFNIYVSENNIIDYSADLKMTSPFHASLSRYTEHIGGLVGGVTYTIGVRSGLGYALESNTNVVSVTVKGNPPLNVSGLQAVATFRE